MAIVTASDNKSRVSRLQFLDLAAQYECIREELLDAVISVMESHKFILGPQVEYLENALACYLGTKFAIACASGSDALLLAMMALGIGAGDEVITTPFTFVATAGSIARLGARPVFVDIDPVTFNIDPEACKRAVTNRTRSIIPVHLFGLPANMQELTEIADKHGIALVEDAAQSLGAEYRGRKVGTIGKFGCFSFFPSKNLGGAGDGGFVATNNADAAERLRMLRCHGGRRKYHYDILGMNSRLDTLQAAILLVKLRYLEEWTERRRANARTYRRMFAAAQLGSEVQCPSEDSGTRHVYNQFTIRVRDREKLRAHLQTGGIPTEIYYPEPLHVQPAFAGLGYSHGAFPEAERASKEVISLPIYPELPRDEQRAVVSAIADFYRSR